MLRPFLYRRRCSAFSRPAGGLCQRPASGSASAAELERCLDLGLRGIGELKPGGQEFDLADEEGLKPLLAIAAENGLPLLVHLSEPVGRLYPGKGRTSPAWVLTSPRGTPTLI